MVYCSTCFFITNYYSEVNGQFSRITSSLVKFHFNHSHDSIHYYVI